MKNLTVSFRPGSMIVALFLCLSFYTNHLNAQTRLFYFSAYNTMTASFPVTSSGVDPRVTSVAQYNSGLVKVQEFRCMWNSTNSATTLNTATAPYIRIVLTFNQLTDMKFDRFVICGLAKFEATSKLQLRWSIDNYATSLGEFSAGASYTLTSVDLNSKGIVSASSIEFRIYVYNKPDYIYFVNASGYSSVDGTPASYGVAGSQNIALWYSPTPTLPLTWKSFTAARQGNSNGLSWSTENETQTAGFTVQHSTDAQRWTNLGDVASADTPGEHRYNYLHATPAAGINYYRIEQHDLDGRSTYSSVVQVQTPVKESSFILRGNPVQDGLIRIECLQPQRIRLISSTGMVIAEKDMAQGNQSIPVKGLLPGMYILVAGNQREQVIIQ